jgi:hypothetical protein
MFNAIEIYTKYISTDESQKYLQKWIYDIRGVEVFSRATLTRALTTFGLRAQWADSKRAHKSTDP